MVLNLPPTSSKHFDEDSTRCQKVWKRWINWKYPRFHKFQAYYRGSAGVLHPHPEWLWSSIHLIYEDMLWSTLYGKIYCIIISKMFALSYHYLSIPINIPILLQNRHLVRLLHHRLIRCWSHHRIRYRSHRLIHLK